MSQRDVARVRPKGIHRGGQSQRVLGLGETRTQGSKGVRIYHPEAAHQQNSAQKDLLEAAYQRGVSAAENQVTGILQSGNTSLDTLLEAVQAILREQMVSQQAAIVEQWKEFIAPLTRARSGRFVRGRSVSVTNDRVQAKIERQRQDREQRALLLALKEMEHRIGTPSLILPGKQVKIACMGSFKAEVSTTSNVVPRGNDPVSLTELVLDSSTWLLASEVSARAGLSNKNPSSTPNKWKKNNAIFAINHHGQDRYPSYALGVDGKPLPVMKAILQAFADKKAPLSIGLWFCSVNSWLGGVAPKDCIETRSSDVLNAAIQEVTPIEHG